MSYVLINGVRSYYDDTKSCELLVAFLKEQSEDEVELEAVL